MPSPEWITTLIMSPAIEQGTATMDAVLVPDLIADNKPSMSSLVELLTIARTRSIRRERNEVFIKETPLTSQYTRNKSEIKR